MILVLDPLPTLVAEVRAAVEALGWTCETSVGDEQAVLSLSGEGDLEDLERMLSRRADVDVIPLLSGREYTHSRLRRKFLAGVTSAFGLAAAFSAGVPLVGFLLPPKKDLSRPDIVRAAGVGELAENSSKLVHLLGEPVLLIHQAGGRYFALSAICTHMGICRLDWDKGRQELVCPCHGGAFDVYGNVVQGPPSVPLPALVVEHVGSDLFVRRRSVSQ